MSCPETFASLHSNAKFEVKVCSKAKVVTPSEVPNTIIRTAVRALRGRGEVFLQISNFKFEFFSY